MEIIGGNAEKVHRQEVFVGRGATAYYTLFTVNGRNIRVSYRNVKIKSGDELILVGNERNNIGFSITKGFAWRNQGMAFGYKLGTPVFDAYAYYNKTHNFLMSAKPIVVMTLMAALVFIPCAGLMAVSYGALIQDHVTGSANHHSEKIFAAIFASLLMILPLGLCYSSFSRISAYLLLKKKAKNV